MAEDMGREAREEAAHREANAFPGRSCVLILEWDARGSVTLRHAGGVGIDPTAAATLALHADATPANTVEVVQALAREAMSEYAFGRWARGSR